MVVTRWGARFRGRRFPCAVGRGGITADKREGDGASPAGIWHLTGGGYRADRMRRPACGLPLARFGPRDLWSDDPADPAYNHHVRTAAHRFGHERLRRADSLYDLILFSDWNATGTRPGKGSAIFVHAWRKPRHPTAGCIAFAPTDLLWVAERLTPRTRILVRG